MWPMKKKITDELKWVSVSDDEITAELRSAGITDPELVGYVLKSVHAREGKTLWGLEGCGGVKHLWNFAVMEEVVLRQILLKVAHLP
jgi:hypothetical protein